MLCPYCQKEMEPGIIQSPQELSWLPGEKRRFFAAADLHSGAVCLSPLNVWKGSAVRAWNCRRCRKILIDYDEE